MSDKSREVYKTEEELKREARIRRENEAKLAAEKPKSKLELKRENFWYHYKWHTVIGATALILAAFFVKDMFFRTRPDATIVMVSEEYFSAESVELMGMEIGRAASDFNGDKKVYIAVDSIMLPGGGEEAEMDGRQDYASIMKLSAVLSAGIDPVYLLDEAAYRYIVGMGMQDGDAPETDNVFCAGSVPAEALGHPEFSGMRFYLRKTGKDEKYYKYCEELIKTIGR